MGRYPVRSNREPSVDRGNCSTSGVHDHDHQNRPERTASSIRPGFRRAWRSRTWPCWRVDVEGAEYWDAPSGTMAEIAGLLRVPAASGPSDAGENEKIDLAGAKR